MADMEKFEALYSAGLALLQDNKSQEAIKKLDEADKLVPNNAEVYNAWGIALTQLKRFPEALDKFAAAVAIDGDNARLLDSWGYCLFEKGDYQLALAKFIQAAEKDPTLKIAFVDWAATLVQLNASEAQLKNYADAVIKAHQQGDAYQMLLHLADQIAEKERYAQAVSLYKRAILLAPDWEQAYQHWLQTLEYRTYTPNELEDYRRAVTRSGVAEVMRNFAIFLVSKSLFEEAAAVYAKIESLNANLPDLDFNIAELNFAQQDYDQAAMRLQQALKRAPEDDQAQLLYGRCLMFRGQYEEAIEEFRAIIARNPQELQAYDYWREAILNLPSADRHLALYAKEVSSSLDTADSYLEVGNLYLAKEQYRLAINSFKKSLERNPQLWPAYSGWAKAIKGMPANRQTRELGVLEKDILSQNKNADGLNVLGNSFFALEHYEEAIERYRQAIEDDPKYGYAYYNWGLSLLRLERPDEAIEKYRKALEVNPSYGLAYSGWGEALHDKGDYQGAVEKYEQAVTLAATNEDIYRNWGHAIRELEKPDEALPNLEKQLYANITTASPYLTYGVLLNDLKRYDDAIKQYQKSLEINPGYALAYYNWGVALELKGQSREAIEIYMKSLELDGKYESTYSNIGKQLLRLEQPDDLLEQFKAAVEKFDQTRGYLELGNTFVELSRLDPAIECYEKVIAREPQNHWALRNWGMALSNQRHYREAIAKFEAATRAKPDFGWGYLDWGIALDAIGEHQQAIEKYQQAIDADPNDPYAHENCGIAMVNLHRYEEAIKKYEEALKVSPNFISSRFRLGNVYLDLLRYDDAIEAYNQTLEANPDYTLITYSSHNIAHIWERRAHFKIARKTWRETVKLYERHSGTAKNRRDAFHFLFYGSIYQFALDDPARAEALYMTGLDLDPGMTGIMINLLQLYLARKQKEIGRDDQAGITRNDAHWKAWEMFRRCSRELEKQLAEGRSNGLLLQQAKLYRLVDRYDEAFKLLKESFDKDRENSDTMIEMGVLHMRQENPREAIKSFQMALDLDPDDLNLKSNQAEAYLKAGDKQRAETIYRDILAISVDHIDSLMGLGEVYTAMGEDALQRDARGDADELFHQALHFYSETLNRNENFSESASKKLSDSEMSALYYARGYTRVKLYESQRKKDDDELATALNDFKRVKPNTANFYKAQRAARKIDERLQKHRELSASWGPKIIFAVAFLTFILAQAGFYVGKPVYGIKEAHLSLTALNQALPAGESDSLFKVLEPLAGQVFGSPAELLATVRQTGGAQAAAAIKETEAFREIGDLEWRGLSPIDATAYGLLTFGALIFMVAGLYLQEISKLKFGAIELEKSSVDQISSSFSFGITRGSLGKTSG